MIPFLSLDNQGGDWQFEEAAFPDPRGKNYKKNVIQTLPRSHSFYLLPEQCWVILTDLVKQFIVPQAVGDSASLPVMSYRVCLKGANYTKFQTILRVEKREKINLRNRRQLSRDLFFPFFRRSKHNSCERNADH